jgi:exonuclease SbcC
MKILELRFKNLNSLYGEWVIDFTDPEYISNGIFALTGPTGAGKSTILDAVCLALYGATPRLGRITKSSNEIMSRGTGECSAEVLFESQAGRFRCQFSQHRARKKAVGDLQTPRHEIAEGIENGSVIENQLRRVATVIEDKTGMDFERFTRSILLAQGGFDTFLKADAEQKSRILEQITGTEIYSEISRRVHEFHRDKRDALSLLQAETSGIVILEPEEEKEIQLDLEAKMKEEKELAGKSIVTGKSIVWLNSIAGLKKEIDSLTSEASRLQTEIEGFKPERSKLEMAVKAALLDGIYAALTALRKQQSDDQAALKTAERALPKLEESANKQAESFKLAEQHLAKAKEMLKEAAPIIRKVRLLDQKIAQQAKVVAEGDESCRKDAEKIDADRQTRLKKQKKRTRVEKELERVGKYLKGHAQDEWLISGLAGIEEQLNYLLGKQNETVQKESDLKSADGALAKAAQKLNAAAIQCAAGRKGLEENTTMFRQAKESLSKLLGDKLLREYRAEKESLQKEKEYLARIAALEDHRVRLEDGKPCPLCGSTEHPFAAGNVPVVDEIEQKIKKLSRLIGRAEDNESDIKKLEKAQAAALKNLNECEKLEANAANDKKSAEKKHAELVETLDGLRADFESLNQSVIDKLQPLGITEIPESEVSSLLKSLRSRVKVWQEHVRNKSEVEKEIGGIDSEMSRLHAVIETQDTVLKERQKNLQGLKKEYTAALDERRDLYGDRNPGAEEESLNAAVADAEGLEKDAADRSIRQQQKLNTAKSSIESLKMRIDQSLPELKKMEADFSSALVPAEFSDEKQFLDCRLTNKERELLSLRAKNLDDAATELKAKQKDRETRLATELAKKVTDKTLEDLEPEFKEIEKSLTGLRDCIAGLKHKVSENAVAKERIKKKQAAIDAQRNECRRWEKLHGLIGSADGKKYRNFAQGLTFELMVSHANRQLQKMSDRYLLIRDKEEPLELNVVDNYQSGEIRSTRNLSGGESFIVSLTLALGLSKMASRKVRVDSLFLDEGFGTLDEDALETALETLSGLQQDGKLIGIISHVSALKERISTQINITPVSGGRSLLSGPGCTKAGGQANG